MDGLIYQRSSGTGTCLYQGEILSGVVRFSVQLGTIDAAEPLLDRVEYPFAVLLSQSCDLSQEFSSRGENTQPLPNLLFCQAPTAEELNSTAGINSTIWNRIKKNKDERYHFLQRISPECDLLGDGIVELCMDFKRYFTIPTDEVYRQIELGQFQRRSVLQSPYLEHLSSRFAYFLGRVGLPQDHRSE